MLHAIGDAWCRCTDAQLRLFAPLPVIDRQGARDVVRRIAGRKQRLAERRVGRTEGDPLDPGAVVGGPVGAAVGGVTGAIVGGIADQQQPEFRQYVTTQKVPSYTYREEVRVGAVLPESGVTLHEVPTQYKVKGYRYTVVNNTPVLVEPSSRKIVQVIQ